MSSLAISNARNILDSNNMTFDERARQLEELDKREEKDT